MLLKNTIGMEGGLLVRLLPLGQACEFIRIYMNYMNSDSTNDSWPESRCDDIWNYTERLKLFWFHALSWD